MKQRMKQALAVMLSVLLLVGAMPALTAAAETLSGSCGDGVTWELDTQTGVLAVAGSGAMQDYPNSFETPWHFHTQEIRELVIGEGVTRIGNYAFAGCQCLETVTFACSTDESGTIDGPSIDPGVIDPDPLGGLGAPVTAETIPEAALTGGSDAGDPDAGDPDAGDPDADCDLVIGNYAFQACTALQDVTIPGRVTHIGRQAFSDCSALRRVVIKEESSCISCGNIEPGMIGPDDNDFDGSSVTVEAIPEADLTGSSGDGGGRSIDHFAFCNNDALQYIHIPADVTDIGDGILAGEGYCFICSDTEVCAAKTYADRESIEFRLCRGHLDFIDLFGACGKDGDNLTWELNEITGTLTISGTGEMADYEEYYHFETKAPWYNWKVPIRTIVIEDGVTRIGKNAFYDCTELTSVTIPESVTQIGESAFEFCTSLASVTIPQGVTQIEDCAFGHCHTLADVTIPDGVTQIDQFAFFDCRSFKHVTIPDGVTTIGIYAFAECESLESVTIPDSVTSLGNYAFYNCESLQSVTMPAALRNTGYRVFYGCPSTLKFYTNHEHSYGEPVWTWAQDYSSAAAAFHCAYCDDIQTVAADVSTTVITEAGCVQNEVVTYTATVTFGGGTYSDTTDEIEIPDTATGHHYGEPVWTWAQDHSSAAAAFTCAECKLTTLRDAAAVDCETLEEAGCETDRVVQYLTSVEFCGETYETASAPVAVEGTALGHDWESETIEEATCTDPCVVRSTCRRCGESVLGEGLPDPSKHDYKADVTEPTCTEKGFTVYTCKRCGSSYTGGYTDPLGHDCDMAVTAPTCTEKGFTTYTCKRCGSSYTGGYTDPLGHDYDSAVTEPTCTEEGFTTCTCKRCGDSYTADETAALGHDFGKWIVAIEPKVGVPGLKMRVCSRCCDVEKQPVDPLPEPEAAALAVRSTDVVCREGQTVTVSVELTQNPGMIAAMLHIRYDPQQLRLAAVGNGCVFADDTFTAGGDISRIPFTVSWSDDLASENNTATGTLLTLTFVVLSDAQAGETAVTVTGDAESTFDADLRSVPIGTASGTVRLIRRVPGDVDDDGRITMRDPVLLLRWLAGWDVEINLINADVNGDGVVDMRDVILIRRYLVGGWDVELI